MWWIKKQNTNSYKLPLKIWIRLEIPASVSYKLSPFVSCARVCCNFIGPTPTHKPLNATIYRVFFSSDQKVIICVIPNVKHQVRVGKCACIAFLCVHTKWRFDKLICLNNLLQFSKLGKDVIFLSLSLFKSSFSGILHQSVKSVESPGKTFKHKL